MTIEVKISGEEQDIKKYFRIKELTFNAKQQKKMAKKISKIHGFEMSLNGYNSEMRCMGSKPIYHHLNFAHLGPCKL